MWPFFVEILPRVLLGNTEKREYCLVSRKYLNFTKLVNPFIVVLLPILDINAVHFL
jgi:hypothetical protein